MLTLPVKHITVTLGDAERVALAQMAAEDERYPKQQINWLIRQEAQRRGLLTGAKKHNGALDSQAGRAAAV